jgi:phosphatidate cytidylyltransferase
MLVNVLGIPGILALIWLGKIYFALFVTIVMLIALYEFYALQQTKELSPIIWIGLLTTLFIGFFYYFRPGLTAPQLVLITIGLILLTLVIELFRNRPHPTWNVAVTLMGVLYIPILLGALIGVRTWDSAHQGHVTFSVIIAIWICDTAAYFVGRKWGRKKIFVRVSPKKTVIGSVAGVMGAFLTYVVMKEIHFLGAAFSWTDVLVFTIITGIFGQIGDFVESLIKRDVGVKDSGKLLMGHGGVLDRFDSLIFASPLAMIYLNLFS